MNALKPLNGVPTHLVLGFLGAGKTTFFNACLTAFAWQEHWAMLVNEVGQIGIDGRLIDDHTKPLTIKQISGGCLCCTSSVSLNTAITELLANNPIDRLWIEPTGLAHPRQLLLELGVIGSRLSLLATIALINACQWQDDTYRKRNDYQAHVACADVVVVNRFMALSADDKAELCAWIKKLNAQATILWQKDKQFSDDLVVQLQKAIFAATAQKLPKRLVWSSSSDKASNKALPMPISDGYYQCHDDYTLFGLRLPDGYGCDVWQLSDVLRSLPDWLRIKGTVLTDDGWVGLNLTPDSFDVKGLPAQADNCLEMILSPKATLQNFDDYHKKLQAMFVPIVI